MKATPKLLCKIKVSYHLHVQILCARQLCSRSDLILSAVAQPCKHKAQCRLLKSTVLQTRAKMLISDGYWTCLDKQQWFHSELQREEIFPPQWEICSAEELNMAQGLVLLILWWYMGVSIVTRLLFFHQKKKEKQQKVEFSFFPLCTSNFNTDSWNKNVGHFLPLVITLLRLMMGKRREQGWSKKEKSFGSRRLERSEFTAFCKTAEEDIKLHVTAVGFIFILCSHPKAGSKQDIQSSSVSRDGHLQMAIQPTTLWCLS